MDQAPMKISPQRHEDTKTRRHEHSHRQERGGSSRLRVFVVKIQNLLLAQRREESLEDELQSKLPDARVPSPCHSPKIAGGEIPGRIHELRVIENIKQLGSKLHSKFFANLRR